MQSIQSLPTVSSMLAVGRLLLYQDLGGRMDKGMKGARKSSLALQAIILTFVPELNIAAYERHCNTYYWSHCRLVGR